jgi:hypothetical protein
MYKDIGKIKWSQKIVCVIFLCVYMEILIHNGVNKCDIDWTAFCIKENYFYT